MQSTELIGKRCEGQLNGEPGRIIETTEVAYLVQWDTAELEDSWEDASDVDLI